ncbi:MAG: histidine phosphatase family protein [Clostridiaceae bacterium]|nr:histidine phosphatase family protein [Clostridiaceae bacterium]
MNIFLIRHGQKMEADKNHEALGLTEEGFKQADLVGRRLQKYSIGKIYSSNMKRAIQTAEGINKYLGVEIITKPELREIHMGDCDLYGWRYLEENYPLFIEEFRKHKFDLHYPPNGECGEDVWQRAKNVISEIIKTDFRNVAVVTHGGVIRSLICGLLKIDQNKRFFLGSPPENCSITMIKYNKSDKEFYIHSFNDYAHLEV